VVQAQRPELGVAAAGAHGAHSHVGAELGVGGLAAELVFLLLTPGLLATAGRPALVQAVAADTCFGAVCGRDL